MTERTKEEVQAYNQGRDDERDSFLRFIKRRLGFDRVHLRVIIEEIEEGFHRAY